MAWNLRLHDRRLIYSPYSTNGYRLWAVEVACYLNRFVFFGVFFYFTTCHISLVWFLEKLEGFTVVHLLDAENIEKGSMFSKWSVRRKYFRMRKKTRKHWPNSLFSKFTVPEGYASRVCLSFVLVENACNLDCAARYLWELCYQELEYPEGARKILLLFAGEQL